MRFILEGPPIPKLRHRTDFRRRIHYDVQKEVKEWVKFSLLGKLREALNSMEKDKVMEASNLTRSGCFRVKLAFYIPVPQSWPESRRNLALWGLEECTSKPDFDNLEKFVLDCCNGVLIPDDRMIVSACTFKAWGLKPRTVIEIMGKKPTTVNDKARGILQIFGPEKLMEFISDVWELFQLYDVDENDDWLEAAVGDDNVREVRLARTAIILSNIAERHAKSFDKIARRFPHLAKDAEKVAKQMEALNKGEVDHVLDKEKEESGSEVHSSSDGQAFGVGTEHPAYS